jgi:4-hydroxy-2-oxoheptanedioate aldolase
VRGDDCNDLGDDDMTKQDPFKVRLQRGDRLHGFFIGHPSPQLVEMVGYAEFDFVIIDQEHSPTDKTTMEHMFRAADAVGVTPLVRVPASTPEAILPALDIGATGILVPHVTDAEKARRIVAEAYYSPLGKRGVSSLTRAAHHGLWKGGTWLKDANLRTTVIPMIEDAEAVGRVGEIASVPGIDAIFVGPSDLGSSLGHLGERQHPELLAAVASIAKQVKAVGGVGLATTAQTYKDVPGLNEQGYSMICHTTTTIIARGLMALRADLKL